VEPEGGRLSGFLREALMYAGKLVFAQVMEFSPWHSFRRLVTNYRATSTFAPSAASISS